MTNEMTDNPNLVWGYKDNKKLKCLEILILLITFHIYCCLLILLFV